MLQNSTLGSFLEVSVQQRGLAKILAVMHAEKNLSPIREPIIKIGVSCAKMKVTKKKE